VSPVFYLTIVNTLPKSILLRVFHGLHHLDYHV